MAYQTIFKRYELKYLLSTKQKELLVETMRSYMELDQFGHSTIRNIYYDTDTYRLIRRSLEKPAYKEKLRVRSYAKANGKSSVFVELKKKYKSVVYKRRIALPNSGRSIGLVEKSPVQKKAKFPEKSTISAASMKRFIRRFVSVMSEKPFTL